MEYDEGSIAEDGAGNFMVYKYGSWHPSDEAGRPTGPIDASARWGAGARELPNGTIERVGPRGGVSAIASGADADSEGVGKLTEGQGKAMLYGGMMAGAERDYQAARQGGYDPASARNQIARGLGVIPFDGDFFGRWARDDVSDAGNQAELRWAEGNLRQLTGAAATNPEIARVAAINFDRGNDELADQRYRTRAETYQGTRYAAGPGASQLPEYPDAPVDPLANATATGGAVGGVGGLIPNRGYDATEHLRSLDQDGNTRISPEEFAAAGYTFKDGGWVPGGGPGAPTASPTAGPDAPSGSQGEGYQLALAQERALMERYGEIGAKRYDQNNFFDQMTASVNDELGYAVGWGSQAIGNLARQATGREIEVSAADRGAAVRDLTREGSERYAREHPYANVAAQVVGAGVTGPGTSAATMPARMVQGAKIGGAFGFAGAEGNVVERLPSAAVGAGVGAVAAPVAEQFIAPIVSRAAAPVSRGFGNAMQFTARQAGRTGNALNIPGSQRLVTSNTPDPLQNAMTRFADRSPQQVNALNTNTARYQAEEIQPTFADVVNDGGRGTLRALATRQTPGREAAREFAESRAAGLQDRVSTQARRTISNDPRSPVEMRSEITTRRNAQADQNFGAVRGETVSPDPDIIQALRAPALRPAIEEAATSALNRGDSQTANMLRQLTEGALDNPNGVQMTVGMTDRISRSLNGRAEAFQRSGNNDAAASYFALAERLRGGARTQVPGYDDALRAYGADSGLAQATELGEQFMSMEADQFAAAVSRLTPEEQQIAQSAARRAVERQAGTQGQAPGVAQRLANGREQGARSTALMGDAAPMQRAMGTELQALRNAQAVNPGQGSQTSMNLQDAGTAAGDIMGAVANPVRTVVGAIGNRIKSRGFNDQEAEAIVTAAIDPARTNELVNMLSERMTRREARNLARAIRFQISTNPPSGQQN